MLVPRRRTRIVVVSAVAALTSLLPGALAAKSLPANRSVETVSMTFRLAVQGQPDPHTTFWVSHGPLAGRFGIFPMHRSGPGRYTVTARFPASARTVFAYLSGQGSIKTGVGRVPGNPVVTMKAFGPMPVREGPMPLVRWSPPNG